MTMRADGWLAMGAKNDKPLWRWDARFCKSRRDAQLIEDQKACGVFHRHDVPWHAAAVPPRGHKCWAQTWNVAGHTTPPGDLIERCACGALRFVSGAGAGIWGDRNSRLGSARSSYREALRTTRPRSRIMSALWALKDGR